MRRDKGTVVGRVNTGRGEMRFDYVIINQEFASVVDDLAATMLAARLRSKPQRTRHRALLTQLEWKSHGPHHDRRRTC
jgi:hypothetical protein